VLGNLVQEEARIDPLALQPALHVGDRHDDGVDRAVGDLATQRVKTQRWFGHTNSLSTEGPTTIPSRYRRWKVRRSGQQTTQ